MEREKIKILIVEDERTITHDLDFKLTQAGYKIVGISVSGENAIKKAAKLKPDLVLMDIVLKGKKDGVQAAETIHINNDIPVVYLTAYLDKKTLSGLLPICSVCKKIRDDEGYWNLLELYIKEHSNAEFTHGLCPECKGKLYPHKK